MGTGTRRLAHAKHREMRSGAQVHVLVAERQGQTVHFGLLVKEDTGLRASFRAPCLRVPPGPLPAALVMLPPHPAPSCVPRSLQPPRPTDTAVRRGLMNLNSKTRYIFLVLFLLVFIVPP